MPGLKSFPVLRAGSGLLQDLRSAVRQGLRVRAPHAAAAWSLNDHLPFEFLGLHMTTSHPDVQQGCLRCAEIERPLA